MNDVTRIFSAIERARQKRQQIHGGGRQRRELHPDLVASSEPDEDLLALDTALARLGRGCRAC